MDTSAPLSSTSNPARASAPANNAGTNVQVVVRCRPLNGEEKKSSQQPIVTCDTENKSVKVAYGPVGKKIMKNFTFDRVFGAYSRQEEVFESVVRPIVDETLAGFNCTIFAYGQTGTGKTHTMEGDINSPEDAGIVPRSVNAILEQLESSGAEFTIRVSFLELYNEELADLLNTSGDKKLKLCEDVKKGVVVLNLEEIAVLSASDIFDILHRGIQQRQTAATLCNKNSSRSHSIFTMKIMIKEYNVEGEEVVRHGQLNLVDLAGSECIGRSGAKDSRAREAGSINQSLLTLGRVITALVDHHGHVPYRDSKLTRLLQESLGGKAKTCIIATLSPSSSAMEETMSTLDYAYRAKSIKNQPTVNQKLTKKVIMKEYFAEIESLKTQLILTREKNGVYMDPAEFYAMEAKIAAQENQLTECESALNARNEEFKTVKAANEDLELRLGTATTQLSAAKVELDVAKTNLQQARGEVTSAFVELRATEAVVAEQTKTESDLSQAGKQLNRSLEERQREVKLLLSKVSALQAQESDRMESTESFVAGLSSRQEMLISRLRQLSDTTEVEAKTLGEGINQMLANGNHTCTTLQTALDDALKVLLGESAAAKDEMVASCASLRNELEENSSSLVQRLLGIKDSVTAWLGESAEAMARTQALMQEQARQIVALNEELASQRGAMSTEATAFIAQQKELSASLVHGIEDWKVNIASAAKAHRDNCIYEATAAKKAMQTKAVEMEEAFKRMLREMVAHSEHTAEAANDSSSRFFDETAKMVESHAQVLSVAAGQRLVDGVEAFQGSVETLLTRNSAASLAAIEGIASQGQVVLAVSTDMHSVIGLKRKVAEEAADSLSADISASSKKACQQVESTSSAAEKVLTNVNTASSRMNESASAATDNFKAFLGQEGEVLRGGIEEHFAQTRKEFEAQTSVVAESIKSAASYSDSIRSTILKSSGDTPTKAAPLVAPVFQRTRQHNAIKREAKSAEELTEITYETVSSLLQAIGNQSSASDSAAIEEEESSEEPAVAPVLKMETLSEEADSENSPPNTSSTRGSSKLNRGSSKIAAFNPVSTRSSRSSSIQAEI